MPERDWTDAVAKAAEHGWACFVTGETFPRPHLAHTVGRRYDQAHPDGSKRLWVNPRGIVLLRPDIHEAYDGHRFDLLPHLSLDEQAYMVEVLGIVRAYERATSTRLGRRDDIPSQAAALRERIRRASR
jgi:hypothetical protein